MKVFRVNKSTPIWIYGRGHLGIPLYYKLIKNGFIVKGFIDQTVDTHADYTIISNNDLSSINHEDIIILTFQNIREHEKVAQILYNSGFDKIVYLYKDNIFYSKLFDLYNELVYSNEVIEFDFPYTVLEKKKKEKHLRSYGKFVIIKIPVQLIFSAFLEAPRNFNLEKIRYNVTSIYEYNALIDWYFNNFDEDEVVYLNRYIKRLCGSNRTIDKFIDDRIELYNMMNNEFESNGLQFFINAPSHVIYDKYNNLLELVDGHHRAVFLANRNVSKVPVRIELKEFEKFINKDKALICKRYLEDNCINTLYTPILHPWFEDIKCITEKGGNLTANALHKFFNKKELMDYKVLDIYSNIGYYSRLFYRMGVKDITVIEPRKIYANLFVCVNDLADISLRIDINNKKKARNESFDIVLLCNDRIIFNEIVKEAIIKCRHYFIVELKKNYVFGKKKEEILKIGKFSKYTIINRVIREGIMCEVIVYEK